MQRKLIGYDVFEKLTAKSLPATQYELLEAEDVLSRVLGTGQLHFHNFNETHVFYKTEDGTYVRANYEVNRDSVLFDNVEEIVIDEATENDARKDIIRNMIDCILEDNKVKAEGHFDEVMSMVRERLQREAAQERNAHVNEASGLFARRKPRRGNKAGSGVFVRYGQADPARSRRAKEGHRKHPRAAFKSWESRRKHDPRGERQKRDRKLYGRFRKIAAGSAGRKHKKTMTEWVGLYENVYGYVDYLENGCIVNESAVKTNPQGDVVAVKIPTSKVRNEGKILSFQLKTLKTDLKILREDARRLSSNRDFVGMVAELKRHNRLSDNNALEECLGDIVGKFSNVLYLTEQELSVVIAEALSRAGVANYGDQECQFMAEGILRVAHGAFGDRVARIHQLSGTQVTESEDQYVEFQGIVSKFYPNLDENTSLESQVFADLYEAALEVRRIAFESKNDELRAEAESFATDLQTILEGKNQPSLELAAIVAGWLENIVETNLESEDWEVVKNPHLTVTGDHPRMAQNAKHPYAPASDFSGDWGSELPQLDTDGKGYKSFGNKSKNNSYVGLMDDGKGAFKNMYPDLENPYVPKAGEFSLHGEPGVDKNWESGLAQWQSSDTWGTGLNNPYVPKSVQSHVNSDNRVDDVVNKETGLSNGKGSLEPKVNLGGSRIDGR